MKPLTTALLRTGYSTFKALTLPSLLLLAAGCSSIPKPAKAEDPLAQLDCTQLSAQRVEVEGIQREAAQAKSGSWKFVMPVFVAVRYAYASHALSDANDRSAKVGQAALAKGCAPPEPETGS